MTLPSLLPIASAVGRSSRASIGDPSADSPTRDQHLAIVLGKGSRSGRDMSPGRINSMDPAFGQRPAREHALQSAALQRFGGAQAVEGGDAGTAFEQDAKRRTGIDAKLGANANGSLLAARAEKFPRERGGQASQRDPVMMLEVFRFLRYP